MKKRPWNLTILAVFFVGVAASFYLQVAWLYQQSVSEFTAITQNISLINKILMGCCLVHAALIWRASKWSLVSALTCVGIVGYNNYLVGAYSSDISSAVLVYSAVGFLLLQGGLFFNNCFQLYREPSQRWWLQAKRIRATVPVELKVGSKKVEAKSFDLSTSGLFACDIPDNVPLSLSESVLLVIKWSPLRRTVCRATVVRKTRQLGEYPSGVGLNFEKLSLGHRMMIFFRLSSFAGQSS